MWGRVSIHAPVQGATFYKELAENKKLVSIHAPVKSATRWDGLKVGVSTRFNPRARKERDSPILAFNYIHCIVSIHAPVKSATMPSWRATLPSTVSIHAPVKSATNECEFLSHFQFQLSSYKFWCVCSTNGLSYLLFFLFCYLS